MWRHQKKNIDKSKLENVGNWLKAIASLTVIMGFTWIFGLLIVKLRSLVFLAYIYTTLIAFQGLLIFIIFVVLSKSVRDSFRKWWKVKVNESDVLSKLFKQNLASATSGRVRKTFQ